MELGSPGPGCRHERGGCGHEPSQIPDWCWAPGQAPPTHHCHPRRMQSGAAHQGDSFSPRFPLCRRRSAATGGCVVTADRALSHITMGYRRTPKHRSWIANCRESSDKRMESCLVRKGSAAYGESSSTWRDHHVLVQDKTYVEGLVW